MRFIRGLKQNSAINSVLVKTYAIDVGSQTKYIKVLLKLNQEIDKLAEDLESIKKKDKYNADSFKSRKL